MERIYSPKDIASFFNKPRTARRPASKTGTKAGSVITVKKKPKLYKLTTARDLKLCKNSGRPRPPASTVRPVSFRCKYCDHATGSAADLRCHEAKHLRFMTSSPHEQFSKDHSSSSSLINEIINTNSEYGSVDSCIPLVNIDITAENFTDQVIPTQLSCSAITDDVEQMDNNSDFLIKIANNMIPVNERHSSQRVQQCKGSEKNTQVCDYVGNDAKIINQEARQANSAILLNNENEKLYFDDQSYDSVTLNNRTDYASAFSITDQVLEAEVNTEGNFNIDSNLQIGSTCYFNSGTQIKLDSKVSHNDTSYFESTILEPNHQIEIEVSEDPILECNNNFEVITAIPNPKSSQEPNEKDAFNGPYSCDKCSFLAKDRRQMKNHEAQHKHKKLHACTFCDYSTPYTSTFQAHMAKHTGLGMMHCEYCDYSTSYKVSFKMHMARHTGRGLLECSECGFQTPSKFLFKKHMSVHSGVGMFSCSECDYTTPRKYHLDRHMVKHTGKGLLKCRYCEYTCIQRLHMRNHEVKHTGEGLMQCAHCPFTTAFKSSLTTHMMRHTGVGMIKCPYCNYKSGFKTNLKRHMKRHESNISEVLTYPTSDQI